MRRRVCSPTRATRRPRSPTSPRPAACPRRCFITTTATRKICCTTSRRATWSGCSRSSTRSAERLPAVAQLRRLIARFITEYEHSAARHRVLVQDVKYLSRAHRVRVVARQRDVVDGFARVIGELAPATASAALAQAVDDDAVRHDELDLHLAGRPRAAALRGPGAGRGGSLHRRAGPHAAPLRPVTARRPRRGRNAEASA